MCEAEKNSIGGSFDLLNDKPAWSIAELAFLLLTPEQREVAETLFDVNELSIRKYMACDPNVVEIQRSIAAGELTAEKLDDSVFIKRSVAIKWEATKGKTLPEGVRTDCHVNACKHSQDFRTVLWFGEEYLLTPNQAAACKILWEARDDGSPNVSWEHIRERAGIESDRAVDTFKKKYGKAGLVCPGEKKGNVRLRDKSE